MTMTAAAMTQKQRAAIEALEAARKQGCSLTQYARTHGLNAQRIYAMLSALRKQGLLPKPARKRSSPFVAVRVQVPTMPVSRPPGGPGVVCRVHGNRYVIECLQWPPASWLASVSCGCTDAAA
jgi:predicted transcriptional regulator